MAADDHDFARTFPVENGGQVEYPMAQLSAVGCAKFFVGICVVPAVMCSPAPRVGRRCRPKCCTRIPAP